MLLAASLFFYTWGEQLLVLLFAGSIVFSWLMGLWMDHTKNQTLSRILLIASAAVHLGILGYLKYADFLISGINQITGLSIGLLGVVMPLGISFYTFQILSYLIDVCQKRVSANRSLISYAAYVSMFPQLVAGPIVRYSDIAAQLEGRTHSLKKTADGITRFLVGLGKKVLIANLLGELCAQFSQSSDPSILFYWLNAAGFMLQIYFDFSGYSDMAIGLGKIFGFTFLENFDYPYISRSITEFWRRWHISLGTWFRDYVYIPLGGNRCSVPRHLCNLFVVWLLTGLWHGASWNYVLWGLFYFVLLMLEKFCFKRWLDSHAGIAHLYVLLMVMLGFVLFQNEDLGMAAQNIAGLFAFGRLPFCSAEALYALRSYGFLLILAIIGATPLPKKLLCRTKAWIRIPLLVLLLLVTTAYLVDGSFQPFLYFRF